LHQAIMSKEQAMILAMLGAIKSRPALKPLIEMANAKQQVNACYCLLSAVMEKLRLACILD